MPSSSFSGAIAETFGSIERALTQIEERDEGDTELHHLRADLLSLLELVERNSGIEAAVDDLYTSASVYVASRKQLAFEPHLAELRFRRSLSRSSSGVGRVARLQKQPSDDPSVVTLTLVSHG